MGTFPLTTPLHRLKPQYQTWRGSYILAGRGLQKWGFRSASLLTRVINTLSYFLRSAFGPNQSGIIYIFLTKLKKQQLRLLNRTSERIFPTSLKKLEHLTITVVY